jgi:hypothetical protein
MRYKFRYFQVGGKTMILCAGNNETFDFAIPIGVGLIDSAINLTRHCLVH